MNKKQVTNLTLKGQSVALRNVSRLGFHYLLHHGLRHPLWLFKPQAALSFHEMYFAPSEAVSQADVDLCRRLIQAYQKASNHPSLKGELAASWSDIVNERFSELQAALDHEAADTLAGLLSSMFQKSFLYGIASADLFKKSWRTGLWWIRTLDCIVALAEAVGVARTECQEQGVIGSELRHGAEPLVQKIEQEIGMPIGFPEILGSYGYKIGNALITPESPEHIYVALRIADAIDRYLPPDNAAATRIVEIGAGFGGTAHWILKARRAKVRQYTIIDLPLVNVFQGYFLSKAFGADTVAFFGEEGADDKRVRVFPTHALSSLAKGSFDLAVNENSMPEMPEEVVERYISQIKSGGARMFYSYNQEADSPVAGIPQILVPAVVKRVGGFHRHSRNCSWIRPGYVEEIYFTEARE